ncbi:MAG: A24 family peptidase [Myxococcales bacterium]
MTWPLHALVVLGALLAAASTWDFAERRIPNGLILAVAATGLFLQGFSRGAPGLASGLAASLVVGALLWGPWATGRVGGGDLKLAAATAISLGLLRLPLFLLATAVVGGFVAAGYYATSPRAERAEVRSRLAGLATTGSLSLVSGSDRRASVPYAVAIALGTLVALRWGG